MGQFSSGLNNLERVSPDYSKSIDVSMPFTAPTAGWFIAHGANLNATVYIDDISVAQGNWQAGGWSGNLNCQVLVDKGSKIKGAAGTVRFIPL